MANPIVEVSLLLLSGLAAGIVNTVAGAGSMITLPALIFVGGLPAGVANGTNRVAVLVQCLFASASFRHQKVPGFRTGLLLAIPACVGAVAGAWLATELSETTMRRVIGILFLALLAPILWRPSGSKARGPVRATPGTFVAFLLLGLHGGFIQVGIGVLILAVFSVFRISLVEGNHVKVVTVGIATAIALGVFAQKGLVVWRPGLVVAIGSAIGGWMGARLVVKKGEPLIRAFLIVTALASSLQLLGIL